MCDKRSYRILHAKEMPEIVKCIFCGGKTSNISPRVRAGGEKVKRYQCQECGRYFQDNYCTRATLYERDYTVVEV